MLSKAKAPGGDRDAKRSEGAGQRQRYRAKRRRRAEAAMLSEAKAPEWYRTGAGDDENRTWV
ncbi:hypothetical protein B6K86_03590 [Lachnospiraceae bacterium]|nr:hypothetical protein B6K86_03590 [Lachnospiraceae bacterium]